MKIQSTNNVMESVINRYIQKLFDCKGHHARYNSSQSSSYKANETDFKICYGAGCMSGFVSNDRFCIGQACIHDQLFAEATHIESSFFNGPYDGILGLGFEEISVNRIPTVFDNLVRQGAIDKPTFSFWINR